MSVASINVYMIWSTRSNLVLSSRGCARRRWYHDCATSTEPHALKSKLREKPFLFSSISHLLWDLLFQNVIPSKSRHSIQPQSHHRPRIGWKHVSPPIAYDWAIRRSGWANGISAHILCGNETICGDDTGWTRRYLRGHIGLIEEALDRSWHQMKIIN